GRLSRAEKRDPAATIRACSPPRQMLELTKAAPNFSRGGRLNYETADRREKNVLVAVKCAYVAGSIIFARVSLLRVSIRAGAQGPLGHRRRVVGHVRLARGARVGAGC